MFEKYTTEELKNSLEALKKLASETGDQFYSDMIIKVVEELSKR
jgi:hypothetical protein